MFEVLNSRKEDIEKSNVLERLGLQEGKYFVLSAHRKKTLIRRRTSGIWLIA